DFAQGDAFRRLAQRGLEALDRLAKAFGAQPEGLMMDRQDEIGARFIGHFHRLLPGAMRTNPGVINAALHQCQINRTASAQLHKRIAERGIARENDTMVISLEKVAIVTAISITPLARAPMFDAKREDVDLASNGGY